MLWGCCKIICIYVCISYHIASLFFLIDHDATLTSRSAINVAMARTDLCKVTSCLMLWRRREKLWRRQEALASSRSFGDVEKLWRRREALATSRSFGVVEKLWHRRRREALFVAILKYSIASSFKEGQEGAVEPERKLIKRVKQISKNQNKSHNKFKHGQT